MTISKRGVGLLAATLLAACSKGPPAHLSIVTAQVEGGTRGKYLVQLADEKGNRLPPDGTLTVSYFDTSKQNALRCKGEGKTHGLQGENAPVVLDFSPPCAKAKPGVTRVSYAFELAGGGKLEIASSDYMTGINEWDVQVQAESRVDDLSAALKPRLEVELKRFAPVPALIPEPGTSTPDPMPCAPETVQALGEEPPAVVLYDDVQWMAKKADEEGPKHSEDIDFISGFYGVVAHNQQNLGMAGEDPRAEKWSPIKHLEIFRVKKYEPPAADAERKALTAGQVSGEISIVDLQAKKVLCHAPASASVVGHVISDKEHYEREALIKLKQQWNDGLAAAEKVLAGGSLKHAP